MDLQLGRAISIVMKTTPYIAYRATVYGVMCGVALFYLLVLGLIGKVFGSGAFVVLLVLTLGAGAVLGVSRLLGEYVLYMLKAGHVALITELATEGELPPGVTQTDFAKERVTYYFKEISVLSLIDQLVKGIIGLINNVLFDVMTVLPIPGLEGATKVVQRVVDFSLTYVDESILAYTFKTKNENVYDAARSGIVLYAQSWKAILKNAVMLTLLSYVFVIACVVAFMVPLGVFAVLMPSLKFVLFLFAIFLGFAAKWILFDPVACASSILTFFAASEGVEPNAEWESRIDEVSDEFRELKEKATQQWKDMGAKPAESAQETQL
jgi:hypothetical protein